MIRIKLAGALARRRLGRWLLIGVLGRDPMSRSPIDPCQTAAGWGECVLADGHETRPSEYVGGRPHTSHIDRWGQSWGVSGAGASS